MSVSLKELIVVLCLSGIIFASGRPTALHFMDVADFTRRRNIWFVLTITAFLSPSFWLFAPIAAPALYWGGKKDSNPLAFYLMLMTVIPAIPVQIPTNGLGIRELFPVEIFRLLSLCVLLPAAWRIRHSQTARPPWDRIDALVLGYGVLTAVLYVPPNLPNQVILQNSFTNIIRASFLYILDAYLLYYVASRTALTRRTITENLAALCLAGAILAITATFESLKHWLLYTDLTARWGGNPLNMAYIVRGGQVRAESAVGNPLALGYLLAISFGCWQLLKSYLPHHRSKFIVPILLLLGLLASFSRGPWLGALVIYFAYIALGERGRSRLIQAALGFLGASTLVLISPIGDKITRALPFLGGSVGRSTLTYRELLADRGWQLIRIHPFFGDQLALLKMQELRQGQGIVDMVNTYLGVALFYGFIGLGVFLAAIVIPFVRACRTAKRIQHHDPEAAQIGAALCACVLGTMLMLADCSFIQGYAQMFYIFSGLCVAYTWRHQRKIGRTATTAPST